MRGYFFGNRYLSSIQQGIQAAHVVSEMFVKYALQDNNQSSVSINRRLMLYEWAQKHKTIILLNGGDTKEIFSLCEFFENTANPLPWNLFFESTDSLGGALTCVGVIVPEKIYSVSNLIREGGKEFSNLLFSARASKGNTKKILSLDINDYSEWELVLAERLNNYELAR